ncbi:MAG: VCBS repeat-containing protein [Myxococcaceae bacterium]|nr:VCBS repeat-containing protein [Myxococcaceae bacterium]
MAPGWGAESPILLPTADGASELALTDLNGDGRLDVVIAGHSSLQVLFNEDERRFEVASFPSHGEAFGLAAADLDADGFPELAVPYDFEGTVGVFAGTSRGPRFLGKWPTGVGPVSVQLRDLDGDGRLDLVVGNGSDNVVTIARSLGDGGFEARAVDGFAQPSDPAIADFDGDGAVDLVGQVHGGLAFRRGDGRGGFAAAERLALRGGLGAMTAIDLDHQGPIDLAVTSWGEGPMVLVLHDALGRRWRELSVGVEPTDVEAADLDADGHHDLVVADHRGERLHVLFNDGQGEFERRLALPTGDQAHRVAVGDLDGDGALDVVSVDLNRAQVFYGVRTGTRAANTCAPRGSACEPGLSCCAGAPCFSGACL